MSQFYCKLPLIVSNKHPKVFVFPFPQLLFNGHTHTNSFPTDADTLVIQLSRGVAEVTQSAVLAVLAPGVVLAADARDNFQELEVAAAVGVAVAFTV